MERARETTTTTLRAGLLAFLVAAITLFSQVLIHRSVSAKLLNNYAFLVISLTMLGFALSGVILTRWLEPFLAKLHDVLTWCAALFVLSLLGASAVFYQAPASVVALTGRFDFVVAYLKSIPLALLYAVPFTFCGLMLGTLLSARQFPTRRVYFFDLAGSAVGAFVVLPAITHLGVEGGLLAAGGAMILGTVLLAPPGGTASRAVAAVAFLVLLGATAGRETVFDLNYPRGSMLASFRELPPPNGIEYVTWDPIARIELSRIPPPDPSDIGYPSLIGDNASFHQRLTRILTQNNFAFTFAVDYDGSRASLDGIEETIYAAAYQATSVERPKVAIAGVGGGIDVLTALYFDASEVTGVEINAATVELVTDTFRDDFRSWSEDPRVRLVVAEGRSYLSTTDDRFDVVQLSGVDSYSGTSAMAHVFSENYLYTSEAWDTYLDRLTPAGIVCMMRLEHKPPKEMLRALITAVGALRRVGVAHPAEHVMMLTQSDGGFTALLVKRTPFAPAERQRLADWAASSPHFEVSATPALNPTKANFYQLFLGLDDPRLEELFARAHPFDVRPTTDDWPFPFKYSYWSHLFSTDPVVQGSMPVMQYSVVLLTLLIGTIACLCIFVPLWRLASAGLSSPGSLRFGIFFAGTGLGYLAIEMALLQKFSLFLGHPNYALSVVLAVLLVSTGLGSLYSERIVGALGGVRFVSYALAFLVLLEVLVLLPRLPSLIGLPFWLRTTITFALVLPLGLCLGVFVPTALERLKVTSPAYVPWAWGINGIFSVLAPVLSVALSMTAGISALMLAAVPVYLVVGFALPAPGGRVEKTR